MLPPTTQSQLLELASIVSILLAHRLTPDRVRAILLNLTKELKEVLPNDTLKDIEAAEAKAVIRAIAYRRGD
jgi:hypothetical protein